MVSRVSLVILAFLVTLVNRDSAVGLESQVTLVNPVSAVGQASAVTQDFLVNLVILVTLAIRESLVTPATQALAVTPVSLALAATPDSQVSLATPVTQAFLVTPDSQASAASLAYPAIQANQVILDSPELQVIQVVEPFFHVFLVIYLALGFHLVIKRFRNGCDQVPFTFPGGFFVHSVVDGFVGLNDISHILLCLDGDFIIVGVVVPGACDALLGIYIK